LRKPASLILGTSLLGKAKAGDNGALGMLAHNHWGWDRPGPTMALSVPNANGDLEDEYGEAKIIIELVKAPKRDDRPGRDRRLPGCSRRTCAALPR
jgi:hypothetical protein